VAWQRDGQARVRLQAPGVVELVALVIAGTGQVSLLQSFILSGPASAHAI